MRRRGAKSWWPSAAMPPPLLWPSPRLPRGWRLARPRARLVGAPTGHLGLPDRGLQHTCCHLPWVSAVQMRRACLRAPCDTACGCALRTCKGAATLQPAARVTRRPHLYRGVRPRAQRLRNAGWRAPGGVSSSGARLCIGPAAVLGHRGPLLLSKQRPQCVHVGPVVPAGAASAAESAAHRARAAVLTHRAKTGWTYQMRPHWLLSSTAGSKAHSRACCLVPPKAHCWSIWL